MISAAVDNLLYEASAAREHDPVQAASHLHSAIELDPRHSRAYAMLAELLPRNSGRRLSALRTALSLQPMDGATHSHLLFAHSNRGDYLEAAKFGRRWLRLHPHDASAYWSLAVPIAYGRLGARHDSLAKVLRWEALRIGVAASPPPPDAACVEREILSRWRDLPGVVELETLWPAGERYAQEASADFPSGGTEPGVRPARESNPHSATHGVTIATN